MSNQNHPSNHGRKRKHPDSGFIPGKGKKDARKTDSDDVLSHAPQSVKIVDFVENRATEIVALTSHVEKIGGTKLVSQRLPRHMRRRALSHDIRRLPKRLREVAAKEIERASTTKRPSRKHRRRPKNLMSDYARRQRRVTWLETHIWHAKRFKMTEKWGYRLALHPNDKSMRACHRAADKYSLLQDVSFECCIEVTGREEMIRQCLTHVVSHQTGATVLARQYEKGMKWGETVLYECDQYPMKALGLVSFLWRPLSTDKASSHRQLWIWSHPASFELVWKELKQSITLETGCDEQFEKRLDKDAEKKTKSIINGAKKDGDKVGETNGDAADTSDVTPDLRDLQFAADGIKMRSLKDGLPKFRLTGQTSQAIVSEVLQPADVSVLEAPGDRWWQKYYAESSKQKTSTDLKQVSDWLKACQSPAEAPPRQVIALTVRDPRLLLPPRRTKMMPRLEVPQDKLFPDTVSDSPLWDDKIRQEVKTSKMADHVLNKKRGENLVPGTQVELGVEESRIPVLLLQRPGYRNTVTSKSKANQPQKSIHQGFGCGWDVIVPPGWGMAFHIAFVFRGCRVGGLREAHAVARESGSLNFPVDYPDTPAGRMHAEELKDELQKKYDRNPPAKRPNYVKMGIQDPFICPWSQLVKEWMLSSSLESHFRQVFVLRNSKMLKLLNEALMYVKKGSDLSRFDEFSGKSDLEQMALANASSLVPVRLTMHGKGVPSRFAHVCIPNTDDFSSLNQDVEVADPCEPKHPDPEGREMKINKKKSKKTKTVDLESVLSKPSNPLAAEVAQNLLRSTSENSFTGAETKDQCSMTGGPLLLNSTCRQIVGFVSDGDFSLGQGQGHGKAFCSLLGLMELLRKIPVDKPCLTLVRNTSSLQYRFAWISVHL